MNTLFFSNGNQLIVPNTFDLYDDKMAYFVSYIYTSPFQHKEYIKSVISSPKKINLKGELKKIGDLRNSGDSSSLRDSISFSSRELVSSYTPYSYVVTSDDYLNYWDGYIPVHSKSMRSIITTKDYGRVKNELINNVIITCKWSYSNFDSNRYTMKYSLTDEFRFSEPKIYDLSNGRFVRKLNNINSNRRISLSPLLQKLENKIFEVDFDYESSKDYVMNTTFKSDQSKKAREIGISIMKNRPSTNYYIREGSKSKRIFSPITSLPRDLRPYLSYHSQSLWDVDISTALPTLFNLYLKDMNYRDVKDYKYLTSDNGENYGLYEYLMELWDVNDREEIKILTMVLFFGRGNTIREFRYLFNNNFPNVYNVMKKMKRKSFKILATTLMRMEREIMIDCIAKNMIEQNENIPLLTIHDGILTTEEYTEVSKSKIRNEIKDRIGFYPKVKIEPLQRY